MPFIKKYSNLSPRQFKEHFITHLAQKGVAHNQRERLKELATGFLDSDYGHVGMNAREMQQFIDAIHENRHEMHLSDSDLRHINDALSNEQ